MRQTGRRRRGVALPVTLYGAHPEPNLAGNRLIDAAA